MPPPEEAVAASGDPDDSGAIATSVEESPVRQLKVATYFVNRTKTVCAIFLALPIVAIALIIVTNIFDIDSPSGAAYFVRNDVRTRLDDARRAARDEFPYVPETVAVQSLTRADAMQPIVREDVVQNEELSWFTIFILLRGRNDETGRLGTLENFQDVSNLFSPENFAILKRAEDIILEHPEYKSFCLRDPNQLDCDGRLAQCALPDSFLNHPDLYGKLREDQVCGRRPGSEPVSKQSFDRFSNKLFSTESLENGLLLTFFSHNISSNNRAAWTMQTSIRIGSPFPGFKTVDDREAEQEELYNDWATGLKEQVDDISTSETDVYTISDYIGNNLFDGVVGRDLSFSIVAIVLVFITIWYHTTSLFLAFVAMLQIILSFPLAYVIYHFIFRQFYFSALQVLTIFLVLGIGADDVFVFTDAWKQASVVLGSDVDLITRMSWTYRRAVKAMTVTSFTTAAAFFVTASSPITPISTLGVWAGTLILLQFFLVITVYPCAVVMWHRFWRQRLFVRFFRKVEPDMVEQEARTPLWHRLIPKRWRPEVKPNAGDDYRLIERFFHGKWFRFVTAARFVLILLGAAAVAVSIWLATELKPPETEEDFLPASHPVNVAFDTLTDGFPRGDEFLQLRVRVTWGISDINRDGTSRFNVDENGKAVYDNGFDLTSAAAQEHILKACEFFEDESKNLLFSKNEAIESSRCWIRSYKAWRLEEGKEDFESFKSEEDLVKELVEFGTKTYSNGTRPYLHFLEGQDIAFNENKTRLVFTEIRFVSDIESQVPYRIMWPVYTKWQDELEELNNDAPDGVSRAIATGGYSWMWQITQRALVRSMFMGIGVMLVVALVTLTVATMNWAIAILATISIGGIVAMLLGMIRLYGWDLGITESIGVVISIGYSFDGAAHIATAYIESKSRKRGERTRDALTDLGISILFGAISTLCAGIMLFPAIIVFFVKFAGLIVTTILLSMVWSLTLFPALLVTVGPEDDFGSIFSLFQCFTGQRNKQAAVKDEENWGVQEDSN